MEDVIISPDTLRSQRVPPNQKLVDKLPILHEGKINPIDVSKWELQIWGSVREEKVLNFKEFSNLPHTRLKADLHCVTGWSKLDNDWEGVSSRVIKDQVDILPQTKHVMVHGEKNFTVNLSLDDFFQEDVLLALKYDNEDLTHPHGYPVRLIVPRLYMWKSVKWVTGLEFMTEERPGFWESRGYHIRGDPWQEQRYSKEVV